MKWIHVVAPEGINHNTQWDVGYCVVGENDNVKYLFCDFGNQNEEVVVSKVALPCGVRYYISLPFWGTATRGQPSLLDEAMVYVGISNAGLVPAHAFSLTQILRDVGDF